MKIKHILVTTISTLFTTTLLSTQSLKAESPSESERLEKLERAVEQLQQRNAELEKEVSTLRKQAAAAPAAPAEGPTKKQVT